MNIHFNPETSILTIALPNGCTIVQDRHPQTNEPITASSFREVARAVVGDEQIQSGIVAAVQERLDAFARTRHYDGILSMCTYATSASARFAAEGQYGVAARDATWAKLYDVLAEVMAGDRAAPIEYADIEAELPVLEWPA